MPRPQPVDCFDDPRVAHRDAVLGNMRYKYLYAVPDGGQYKATIFLVHGWPDLSMGWRYQIPTLLSLGLRVVAPDMAGYGGTDAPHVPPETLWLYGWKAACDAIAQLAAHLNAPKIFLGGHDWGGVVVYRCALYYPSLISGVFSVCTPYWLPNAKYWPLETVVQRVPQFGYQLHLAGPEVEKEIQGQDKIRQFLNGFYGAKTEDGRHLFNPMKGVDFKVLPHLGKTKLLSDREMDYYVQEYSRHGLHGPLNWYRSSHINFTDEKSNLPQPPPKITCPVLYIAGKKDRVLLPSMSKGMEDSIDDLTRIEVNTSHWALWEDPEGVNACIQRWFESLTGSEESRKGKL